MTFLSELAAVVVAVIGAVTLVRAIGHRLHEHRLKRACLSLLARHPPGVGLIFPIRPDEVAAARWGERHGWLGVRVSPDGHWSIYRKNGFPV